MQALHVFVSSFQRKSSLFKHSNLIIWITPSEKLTRYIFITKQKKTNNIVWI